MKKHYEQIGFSDEWYTPKYIFDAMELRFDLDVASPKSRTHTHVPADMFYASDSLELDWTGTVWMNPPFGGINGLSLWLDKIYTHGDGIALTPDRSSAKWWQKASVQCDGLLQINHRVKFIDQNGVVGKQPTNGITLFAYGDKALEGLKNAELNGLGALFVRYFYI